MIRGCSSCASKLVYSSVSFGPLQTQLLIINNSVYLYQNHYLNWLHDTYCFPNCTLGKIGYKICDFVLCNYPSMGYKTLHLCLKQVQLAFSTAQNGTFILPQKIKCSKIFGAINAKSFCSSHVAAADVIPNAKELLMMCSIFITEFQSLA